MPTHIILTGVSGIGKTTIATALDDILGWPYAEADDFHPQANKEKMARGVPLNDDDRWPWLCSLRDWMNKHAEKGESTLVTCSALKHTYRDLLSQASGRVFFAALSAEKEVVAHRMAQRTGHFMPASLLDSQYADLEPLAAEEDGTIIDATGEPDAIAGGIVEMLELAS